PTSLLRSVWLVRDVLDTVRRDLPQVPENLSGEPLDLFVSGDMVPLLQHVTPGTEISGDDHRGFSGVRKNGTRGLPRFLALVSRVPKKFDNVVVRQERFVMRDRKSTRLNSSHVKISYAV